MKHPKFRVGDKILYQFNRSVVEAGHVCGFLETFGLDRLPTGRALRPFYNSFGFVLAGYDNDPRVMFVIPEVRAFFQAFRKAWPYWFFACDIELPCLQAMTFCCLPTLQVVRREGESTHSVLLDPRELKNFALENYQGMNLLFERAGMTERENRSRTKDIFNYYQRDWNCFGCL
jgi:hypothetical protein